MWPALPGSLIFSHCRETLSMEDKGGRTQGVEEETREMPGKVRIIKHHVPCRVFEVYSVYPGTDSE